MLMSKTLDMVIREASLRRWHLGEVLEERGSHVDIWAEHLDRENRQCTGSEGAAS